MSKSHLTIWQRRLNWLRAQIQERQIGIDATLMADNLEQAMRWDDEIRTTQIWNLFVVGNPAFDGHIMP